VFKMSEGSFNSLPIEQTVIGLVRFSILYHENAICKTIIKRTFQGCNGAKGIGKRGTNNLGNEELTAEASEQPTIEPTTPHTFLKHNKNTPLTRWTIGNEL